MASRMRVMTRNRAGREVTARARAGQTRPARSIFSPGQNKRRPDWMQEVLQARDRDAAAPTFSPDGLYFLGPRYAPHWGLPERTPAFDGLP